jgi:hypothetical protein
MNISSCDVQKSGTLKKLGEEQAWNGRHRFPDRIYDSLP